jgi:hypothetical protein
LVGNPNRHKPLAEHRPLNKPVGEEKAPAAMYALETRYRPIPNKVLPSTTDESHVLYHIEPKQARQSTPPIIRHGQSQDLPGRNNPLYVFSLVEPDTPPPQAAEFLEPKIISAPVLYAIVAQKNYPAGMSEPVLSDRNLFLPFVLANAVVSLKVLVTTLP